MRELNKYDWNVLSAEKDVSDKVSLFYSIIEDAVSNSFDNLIEKKSERKNHVPKHVKKWFSKKKKISDKIMRTKSKNKLAKLMEEIEIIEIKIKESHNN